jgi:hypothetical protein
LQSTITKLEAAISTSFATAKEKLNSRNIKSVEDARKQLQQFEQQLIQEAGNDVAKVSEVLKENRASVDATLLDVVDGTGSKWQEQVDVD